MSKYLYHGSSVPGIETLYATSKLHGSENTQVVYLTESIPYALFYIWDANHNKRIGKHVTAWIKEGIVSYEEQFPNMLYAFYKGVSGYIYYIDHTEEFSRVENREAMWYSFSDAKVTKAQYIADVYEELLKYEIEGKVKIIRYEKVAKERIQSLYEHMAERILKENLPDNPKSDEAVFYQTYFEPVWKMALEKSLIGKSVERFNRM